MIPRTILLTTCDEGVHFQCKSVSNTSSKSSAPRKRIHIRHAHVFCGQGSLFGREVRHSKCVSSKSAGETSLQKPQNPTFSMYQDDGITAGACKISIAVVLLTLLEDVRKLDCSMRGERRNLNSIKWEEARKSVLACTALGRWAPIGV